MNEFEGTNHGYLQPEDAEAGYGLAGGIVKRFLASQALLIGDAVHITADSNEVGKASATTLHDQRVGIVVGGTATEMKILSGSDALGLDACLADQDEVLVLISGIAWAVADADTVAIGDSVKEGETTAGRVLDQTATAGVTLGMALDTAAAAGDPIRVLVALS